MPLIPSMQKMMAPKPLAQPHLRSAGVKIPNVKTPGIATPMHMADGGFPSSSEAAPWYTRDEEHGMNHNAGFLPGNTGGRTDNLPINVPVGSHVIPADVVSGLGEGNTLSGAAVLDRMLHTGPHGMRLDGSSHRNTIPSAPRPARESEFARGGEPHGHKRVPIIAAAGEFVVHPDAVRHLGGGDPKKGHKLLNAFIEHVRKKTAKKMLSLPGPK